MMNDYMLPQLPAQLEGNKLTFEMRMPWYRALPLSSITKVQVEIDNQPCDMQDARFLVNDREYRFEELPLLAEDWWYVLDSAWIKVTVPEGFKPGKHEVRLHFGLYIPYLPVGPFILLVEEESAKELEVLG
jgi:hypothetical protein